MIVLWGFPLPLPTRVQRVKKIEQFSYFSALVVQGVPSHKLLPLGYQMVARLAAERSPFQAVLRKVLARLAIEHPHHMLLHVLALTHLSGTGRDAAAASLLDVRPPPRYRGEFVGHQASTTRTYFSA